MKYSIFLILIIFCVYNAISQAYHYRRYNVESGVIEYEITGTSTGIEKLVFKDWGRIEVKYTSYKSQIKNEREEFHYSTFIFNDTTLSIDFNKKTGIMMKNDMPSDFLKAIDYSTTAVAFKNLMEKMGAKYIATEYLFGKECMVWQIEKAGIKFWTWNNITLKTEVNFMGINTITQATNIDINESIPDESFAIPKGITIKELERKIK